MKNKQLVICMAGSRHLGYMKNPETGDLEPCFSDDEKSKNCRFIMTRLLSGLIRVVEKYDVCLHRNDIRIIHGGCPTGVDAIAGVLARKLELECQVFPADWDKHGKAAGPIRNREMAQIADILVLLWDGKSRGSKNCKEEFKKLGKPFIQSIIEEGEQE